MTHSLGGPAQHGTQRHWVMQAPSPWQGCDPWKGCRWRFLPWRPFLSCTLRTVVKEAPNAPSWPSQESEVEQQEFLAGSHEQIRKGKYTLKSDPRACVTHGHRLWLSPRLPTGIQPAQPHKVPSEVSGAGSRSAVTTESLKYFWIRALRFHFAWDPGNYLARSFVSSSMSWGQNRKAIIRAKLKQAMIH